MISEKIRGCGRSGGAPRSNRNASKRPAQAELDEYARMLPNITRTELARHLGVAVSTTYRWIPAGGQVVCPKCGGLGGFSYPPGNWVDCSVCEGRKKLDADVEKALWVADLNRLLADELSRSTKSFTEEMMEAIRSGIPTNRPAWIVGSNE